MAVTQTEQRSGESARGNRKARESWFKKNKTLTILGGGVAALLLLAHGGKSKEGELAAEQAALEQQRAALEQGNILPSGSTAGSGGGGENGGGGGGSNAPELSRVVGNTPTSEDITKLTGALEGIEQTAREHPDETQNGGQTAERPEAKATPSTTAKKSKNTPHKQAGVTVNGRFFPGATGYKLGPIKRNQKGETSREVTVDKGGKTERFISHNGGKSWTDKPRGVTPPHPHRPSTPHISAPQAPARKPKAKTAAPAKPKPAPAHHAAKRTQPHHYKRVLA